VCSVLWEEAESGVFAELVLFITNRHFDFDFEFGFTFTFRFA
jgi:hypothetical protein